MLGIGKARGDFRLPLTIEYTKAKGFPIPEHGFNDHYTFNAGGLEVITKFFGEGHTKDNVVAYVPADQVLFGGCLIKENGAGKGNLEDANTAAWSNTVAKVKAAYPRVRLVIPGHGKHGGTELLDYTLALFQQK